MSVGRRPWRVRIVAAADADFRDILAWTHERFGPRQARTYAATLSAAIAALAHGPAIPGAKARDDIAPGLFTLHVARGRRKGRHFVVFRTAGDREERVVEVLRILHDAMDLPRHLTSADDD